MSEYTFGDMSYSGGQPSDDQHSGVGAGQPDQGPKWFREYMAKSAQQIETLTQKLEAAETKERQAEITTAFESRGYARSAAALYQGTPDKVDEWLSAHGDALARTGQSQQDQQRPPGETAPPQQTAPAVPPSVQADLQRMQQMGQTASTSQQGSSDDDLAAALRATTTPEEFQQVAAAHGWQYSLENMGFV